jgi:hypothetical protein
MAKNSETAAPKSWIKRHPIITVVLVLVIWAIFPKFQPPPDERTAKFQNALNARIPSKDTIYLRDLTDFEWDTVCAMGGYAHLQEDLNHPNILGINFPELANYPNNKENEWALLFIDKKQIAAVIKNATAQPRYILQVCANKKNAYFLTLPQHSGIPFEQLKKNNYRASKAHIRALGKCSELPCSLVFAGEKDD